MAMMAGNGGGGRGRSRGRGGHIPMSEINVTPLVDVMLVLLIVFMVTAPLLTVGVPVDLPKTNSSQMVGQDEPLMISINSRGIVFLQETEIPRDQLVPRLEAITQNKKDTRIFVRGDQAITYGEVMEVMGLVNLAGFNRVALVTELPQRAGPGGKK
ncbi:MAG: Biopolymer transport protein ExbD [Alphaproteobacteria bacterium MarineAlpha11_Bin1]|nr:MAG: Biopolymer transport protein ExbD [Alphaproteobacteria bacterium MarineAlpha11_Bin1]|tara:strand:+ start:12531 stop:12998 length:468 start_codon:yes stop_codon:yes gene_type:complete